MAIIETIIPIFLIIIFGYILQQRGLLTAQFIQEANRFVFLFSLPVLIFTGIMKSDIKDVALVNILSVIIPTLVILCLAFLLALAMRLKREPSVASFKQPFTETLHILVLPSSTICSVMKGSRRGAYS